jgi:Skp family chaperone for outer membrane proteins
MKTTLILTASLALALTNSFAAGIRDRGVNTRQHEQQGRIHEGVKSGELTRSEAKGLQKEEKDVRAEERQFKSDGKLTVEERQKLQSDLNKTSKDIHNQKHDAEVRKPADPVVNARQRTQQGRIGEGVKSGQLTGREAVKLEREERAVRTEERAYKADGKLTPAERKDLNQDLNKVSRDIYKEKHDAQAQPGVAPATPKK